MKKQSEHPSKNVAVGYARVSTTEQGASGLSLMEQDGMIHRYCEYQGLELLTVCQDEITGKTRVRPGLDEALGYIKSQQARIFVVRKLARLGRKVKDLNAILEEIQEAGGELVILDLSIDTRTNLGRMLYAIVAHLAEGEGEEISQRTKDAMVPSVLPRQGTHVDRNGNVKRAPGNPNNKMSQATRNTIMRLRSRKVPLKSGKERPMSYAEIAEELNALSIPTVNGNPWTKSTIHFAVQDELARDRARQARGLPQAS